MRIIICDDLESDRTSLYNNIKNYCILNKYDIDIDTYSNSYDLLNNFEDNKNNILFLDIYLNDESNMTGIDIARKIRDIDSSCIIIFTTLSSEFALDAFSVYASAYLIKPVKKENLDNTLNRCFSLLSQPTKYIEVLSNRLIIKIEQKNILYIEVFNKYCLIHTTSDSIKTYMTLSQIEKLLDTDIFLRCHRSYIVNLEHVKNYSDYDFILSNGNNVPISKDKKISIKQVYLDYLFYKTRN